MSMLMSFFGAKAAAEAARRNYEKGRKELQSNYGSARDSVRDYGERSIDALSEQTGLAKEQIQNAMDLYNQQIEYGNDALSSLYQLYQGGGPNFAAMAEADPMTQAELSQAEKVVRRNALASGTFGSSDNLRQFADSAANISAQGGQRAYQRYLGLLEPLIGYGQQGLANQYSGYGNIANLESQLGANIANANQWMGGNLSSLYANQGNMMMDSYNRQAGSDAAGAHGMWNAIGNGISQSIGLAAGAAGAMSGFGAAGAAGAAGGMGAMGGGGSAMPYGGLGNFGSQLRMPSY